MTAPQPQLVDITMPSLGADMVEGMLVQWLVKLGDRVYKGDIIAVLETNKGAIDMEAYQSGVITEILVQPIATVPVGTVLATLRTDVVVDNAMASVEAKAKVSVKNSAEDSEIKSAVPTSPPLVQVTTEKGAATPQSTVTKTVPIAINNLASPAARKMAEQRQLDLTKISGSGPHGAILLNDLAQSSTSDSDKQQAETVLPKMRNAIAAAMTKSKKEIPHFYVSSDIDMTNAQRWLQEVNADQPPEQRILLVVLLLKAVASALLKYPALNGFYNDEQLQPVDDINIGNVISLRQGGLVVPAIHNVDWLSMQETMRALRDITARSRTGHLRSSELADATITVTNMGERGADSVFGVIYPPQVAIIGFGKVRKVAQVKGEVLAVGYVLTACLSVDHRAIDGMLAAKFLTALSDQLQQPDCL